MTENNSHYEISVETDKDDLKGIRAPDGIHYPPWSSAKSYKGRRVPAQCVECGTAGYLPPASFAGKEGHCPNCEIVNDDGEVSKGKISTWERWDDDYVDVYTRRNS